MQLAQLSVLLFVLTGCASYQQAAREVSSSTNEAGILVSGSVEDSTVAVEIEAVKCSAEKKRDLWVTFKYVFWGQGGSENIWKERIC